MSGSSEHFQASYPLAVGFNSITREAEAALEASGLGVYKDVLIKNLEVLRLGQPQRIGSLSGAIFIEKEKLRELVANYAQHINDNKDHEAEKEAAGVLLRGIGSLVHGPLDPENRAILESRISERLSGEKLKFFADSAPDRKSYPYIIGLTNITRAANETLEANITIHSSIYLSHRQKAGYNSLLDTTFQNTLRDGHLDRNAAFAGLYVDRQAFIKLMNSYVRLRDEEALEIGREIGRKTDAPGETVSSEEATRRGRRALHKTSPKASALLMEGMMSILQGPLTEADRSSIAEKIQQEIARQQALFETVKAQLAGTDGQFAAAEKNRKAGRGPQAPG